MEHEENPASETRPIWEIPSPEPLASPAEVDSTLEEMWYRPSWSEAAWRMGWRWLWFLPPAALVAAVLLGPRWHGGFSFMLGFWKLVLIVFLMPLIAFARQATGMIQSRKGPFCIHCGYGLTGLPDRHVCPECGRPYTFARIEEYRRDPDWFIQRYRNRHSMPAPPPAFEAGPVRRKRSRDGT